VLGPGAWWYGPLFAIHRWWYWALTTVRAWWYWALVAIHAWWCGASFAVRACMVVLGPRSPFVVLGPHRCSCNLAGVLVHHSCYWALVTVGGWWYWVLVAVHATWHGSSFTVHATGPLSLLGVGGTGSSLPFISGGAGICGWCCWALVALFMGGGGAPCRVSCAMVHGSSSLSLEGEGHGLLFVCRCSLLFMGAHGLEVVDGHGVRWLGDVALPSFLLWWLWAMDVCDGDY